MTDTMKITKDGIEIWKDILGYEGLYQINNEGKVRKVLKDGYKMMKLQCTPLGYKQIGLTKDHAQQIYYVHRLVLECFVELPDKNPDGTKMRTSPECNHKDGNRGNNYYRNLEWCDRYYNNSHRRPSTEWIRKGE